MGAMSPRATAVGQMLAPELTVTSAIRTAPGAIKASEAMQGWDQRLFIPNSEISTGRKYLAGGSLSDNLHECLIGMPMRRVASSAVEHSAFNRLVLSSNLRRPICSKLHLSPFFLNGFRSKPLGSGNL